MPVASAPDAGKKAATDQPVRLESRDKESRPNQQKGRAQSKPAQKEDLVSPQILSRGGNQRRSKGNMTAIISAVIILLVAGGVTFWLAEKWKKDKQPETAGGGSGSGSSMSDEAWRSTGWKKEASEVLNGFMTAKSPLDRMGYVIANDGVLEELEIFYPEGSDDSDTPKESFGHVMGSDIDHQRGIFLMQYRQPAQIDMREYFAPIGTLDRVMGQESTTLIEMAHRIDEHNLSKPVGINAFFKKTDKGLKLDASVFIQGKFRTFRAFVDYPRPGKTQVFRVVASESLSHELRNNKQYRTYRFEDFAYPQDYVNVPVLVDSDAGKVLSELNWRGLNKDRTLRTATVELGWSNESPAKLQIVKVICWEFLGVGGEVGNTAPKAPAVSPAPGSPPSSGGGDK